MKNPRLTKVTFTGIDKYTKKKDLVNIKKEFPYVEFGILTSTNWREQGLRYPSPKVIQQLYDKQIDYSLHLCGKLARLALINDYSVLKQTLNPNILNYFSRIQINTGNTKSKEKYNTSYLSKNIKQVIIQTSNIENIALYENLQKNSSINFAPLFDPSGGKGLINDLSKDIFNCNAPYLGIAGGINLDNCIEMINSIIKLDEKQRPFWIDMESSIRDVNDKFSTEICYEICKKINKIQGV